MWYKACFSEVNTDVGGEKHTQFYCLFSDSTVIYLETVGSEPAEE